MSVQPNTAATIDFLSHWEPDGPWVLTSIVPDGLVETKTFAKDAKIAGEWIAARQGKANLYFSVNRPRGASRRNDRDQELKLEKGDVGWFKALHVDCDPRAGEPIVEERTRILAKMQSFEPKPSVVLDSGGGYQAFWLLREPQEIDDPSKFEAYNKQLEILFGADHCFNIDRVMRLPGTINVPNKKKKAKGRVPVQTAVVSADWSLRYALSDFTPAPMVASPAPGQRVEISGNIGRVDLDDLPKAVPDWCKMVILHGRDPQDPSKYGGGDRSKAVFAVACELVRDGCSDDVIAAILLDTDYDISGHVHDQKRPEQYVVRQISRAKEVAISPELEEINSIHCVVSEAGKTRIFRERYDEATKRVRIERQTFEDFRNLYCHRKVKIGTTAEGDVVFKSLGKWWLEHPNRRTYHEVVFWPKKEATDQYNLWRGFACEAVPGKWDLFRAHVFENVCGRDRGYFEYLLKWMARSVQEPDCPGEVAVVMRGKRGAGKGVFAHGYGGMFGQHYLQVSNSKHLVGNFNAHLRDCVVLFADEAFWAGDKQGENTLKTLITEPNIPIEAKGVDITTVPNYLHLIMSSNHEWVIPAGHDERRYFVLDVADDHARDFSYFEAINHELKHGGREAMLHELLNLDLSDYQVRKFPTTEALRQQKVHSFPPEWKWWFDKLDDGRIVRRADGWALEVTKDDLQADYQNMLQTTGNYRKASSIELGMFLTKMLPKGWPKRTRRWVEREELDGVGRVHTSRQRVPAYQIPPILECRRHFDAITESKHPWSAVEDVADQKDVSVLT